jgi:bifunctional ADP-heptose synthase (sugar kinase/adenylyltransferase)
MGKKNILIIGDTIIDHDIFLDAIGLSLESPTLKTIFKDEKYAFGGAANVARFAAKLGAEVTFVTSMTKEKAQYFVTEYSIKLINLNSLSDNIKSRNYIKKGDEQYNFLQVNNYNKEICSMEFIKKVNFNNFDVVAISDYRCGFLVEEIIDFIRQQSKILYAASQLSDKKSNYEKYHLADFLVCNEEESKYIENLKNVYITLGKNGCTFNGINYPSNSVNVVRTIGAGDVFYAAILTTESPISANEFASKYVSGGFA